MALRSILPFRLGAVLTAALLATACGGGGSDSADQSNPNPLVADAAFGEGGNVRIALGSFNGALSAIVEQPDGKLIAAGYRKLGPSVVEQYPFGVRPKSAVFVTRYLENGQLDSSFGSGGTVDISVRGADISPYLKVMEDGEIYISVNASRPCNYEYGGSLRIMCVVDGVREDSKTVWVKLKNSGELDAGPAGDGLNAAQLPEAIRALANQVAGQRLALEDGKYLVLQSNTYAAGQIYSWSLMRYLADGSVDSQFGTNGVVYSRCKTNQGRVVADRQGNVWVVSAVSANYSQPSADMGLCTEKISESGLPSVSAPNPIKTALGANVSVHDAKLTDDGALMVVLGTSNAGGYGLKALKYQPDGNLMDSYGTRGIADLQGLSADQMARIGVRIVDGSGAMAGLAPGQRSSNSNYDRPNLWAQWLADGTPNKRFGNDGILTMGDMPDFSIRAVALVDRRKRWLMQTTTSASAHVDSEGSVTLTRLVGDSH